MEIFIGFISPFPYDFPPAQWARCQGQLLSVGQYSALFSLLGVNFGGDARSNFGLPDLQSRQIIGAGTSQMTGTTYRFAQMGGMEQVALNSSQVPLASHTHPATFTPSGGSDVQVRASTNPQASSPVPEEGSYLAAQKAMGGVSIFVPGTPTPTTTVSLGGVSGGGGDGEVTVDPNTATQAHSPVPVMNPYLALNFCIALEGIYPSRN